MGENAQGIGARGQYSPKPAAHGNRVLAGDGQLGVTNGKQPVPQSPGIGGKIRPLPPAFDRDLPQARRAEEQRVAERGNRPRGLSGEAGRARRLIENAFAKLKQFRAIATRYDKTARNFLAAIHLAAAVIWLN